MTAKKKVIEKREVKEEEMLEEAPVSDNLDAEVTEVPTVELPADEVIKKTTASPQVVERNVVTREMAQIGTVCTECGSWFEIANKPWCPACGGKTVNGPRLLANKVAEDNAKRRGIK
jgi:hypothetical protein